MEYSGIEKIGICDMYKDIHQKQYQSKLLDLKNNRFVNKYKNNYNIKDLLIMVNYYGINFWPFENNINLFSMFMLIIVNKLISKTSPTLFSIMEESYRVTVNKCYDLLIRNIITPNDLEIFESLIELCNETWIGFGTAYYHLCAKHDKKFIEMSLFDYIKMVLHSYLELNSKYTELCFRAIQDMHKYLDDTNPKYHTNTNYWFNKFGLSQFRF